MIHCFLDRARDASGILPSLKTFLGGTMTIHFLPNNVALTRVVTLVVDLQLILCSQTESSALGPCLRDGTS